MTYDKQNNGHLGKPFTPTLSAAFSRSNKCPLTPKLASPSLGKGTSRFPVHLDHPQCTTSKEDLSTVPPTYLSANITPRSGSRNIRRDAAFSSPTSTPPASISSAPYSQHPVGAGVSVHRRAERSPVDQAKQDHSRISRAKGLTAEHQSLHPNSFADLASGSPMFFHASDARSTTTEAVPSRPRPGKMSPTPNFVYANGDQGRQLREEDVQTTTSAGKRRSGRLSRTMSGTKPSPPPSPHLEFPRVSDGVPFSGHSTSAFRIFNLERDDTPPKPYGSPPSDVSDKFQPPLAGKLRKSSSVDSTRDSSCDDGLRASPVIVSNINADCLLPKLSDQIPPLRPRLFSDGSVMSTGGPQQSVPLSPGKSEGPSGDLALNARTERKIMDLEISNSSLLAINRTLEREMRKQSAELRRYQRLSRSGRLSMAASGRAFSGAAFSTISDLEEGVSELSSIRSQDDLSDYSDEDSVADEGVLSPDSLAEHDAKYRAQDEKRFILDLARHQELLIDSQKLNQSLKRCLGWTEELIREGQKALEYSVHVQDIDLGGRVLSPEELGDMGESGRGLLSPPTKNMVALIANEPSFDNSLDPATLSLPPSPGGMD